MRTIWVALASVPLVGLAGVVRSEEAAKADTPAAATLGQRVDDFQLQDFRGKAHALADMKDAKAVVIAFLGTECPLCKLYGPRLAELAKEFGPQGVEFVGVDANRQDSITEMAAYARLHGIEFPLLKDTGNVLADRLRADRTPEVFVLDRDRQVRYRGRIDDQYGFQIGTGYQRPKIGERYLVNALAAVLAEKPVDRPLVEAVGCRIGRVRKPNGNNAVTYSNQIARLFQERCVECHRPGQIGPFAMTSYEEVAGWAEMIDEVVREQRMPPWHANPQYGHFSNDYSLSTAEKELIATWVKNGAPEGDPKELPPRREYAGSWHMPGGPDAVFKMRKEPYDVPAEGTVEYQYFVVDTNFKEDKWVKVAECMPDNRAVVHHIIVFVKPPQGTLRDIAAFNHLTGFAPGTRPHVLPEGMAKLVPAGSQLVFQMHYTPNGTPQKDCSMVGMKFEDPKNVKWKVATLAAGNHTFEIPPGADNHRVESQQKFGRDVVFLSLFPHMHLRGKSFFYEAIYPDGRKETLLDVPRYDFNWQNSFIFSELKTLPKGTTLHCVAHFDNSEHNLANPDPTATVRWGDQTWEEMMLGWFDMAVPVDASLAEAVPQRVERQRQRERGERRRGDDEQKAKSADAPKE